MGFPAIAIELGLEVGLWAVNKYLLDRGKKLPPPQPDGLEFPLASVDTTLPYVAGTVRVQPVLIWYGNRGSTLLANGTFRYRANMLFAIGVPMWDDAAAPWGSWRAASPPKLRSLWYGARRITLRNTNGAGPLLHGQKAQVRLAPGGTTVLEAGSHFYDGRANQTITGTSVALAMATAGIDATNIPGYQHRMLLTIMATAGQYSIVSLGSLGSDPRVPAVAVEVSALGPQPIGLDANPAWVIYDLLCRPVWGLGIDAADVDLASFQDAADMLVAEGHGCSLVVQQPEEAARILAAIQAQVDGILYEAPASGLITFKLIRSDYDPDALPVINASNTLGRPTVDDMHERDCPNEMRVSFTDRSRDYKRDTVPWKKEGNAAIRSNQRRAVDFDAPGCTSASLAASIAARELSVAGRPLRTIRLKVNRSFYDLELGDVVKVNLPQYQIVDEVYRVMEVDYGQLADGALELRLLRDVFDQTAGGFPGDPSTVEPDPTIAPLTTRYFDEAPYYLAYLGALSGWTPNLGEQRLMIFAAAEPAPEVADRFRTDTSAGGPSGFYGFGQAPDISPQRFPTTATVAVAYPRTAEPYDTSVGLVVENIGGEFGNATDFLALVATPTQIRDGGYNLFLLDDEFISFESVTSLGGGQYRLNNIGRGELDSTPVDHAIGARLYQVRVEALGHRDWTTDQWARGTTLALYGAVDGSDGQDATDDLRISVVGRRFLPLRAADMVLRGYDLDGTAGDPEVLQTYPYLGDVKAASRIEGALDVSARENRIDAGLVVRGDETTWSAESGVTWTVRALKANDEDAQDVELAIALTSPMATGLLLGGAGHGEIDVILDSKATVGTNAVTSWQSPAIRVTAPTWRNLLAYDSFDAGTLAEWTEETGTVTVESGTDSLPRWTSAGHWIRAATASATLTRIYQTVDVIGYKPTGLTAVLTWYTRNFASATTDYSTGRVIAYDASDSVLDDASADTIGPLNHWRRNAVSLSLPAGTVKVGVELTLTAAVGEVSKSGATRVRVQIGQVTSELLTNPSFDGSFTGWTNVTNSFVANTALPYASDDGTLGAAQGGAFASSEIKQEASIPAGFTYGVALLTLARATTIAGDAGTVTLEALNGSTVLASATTGAESDFPFGVDKWARRRLALQLPNQADTLRVRLLASRAAGSGNSGALFDDLSLRVHKNLDPVETVDIDFREPVWQPAPRTWQRFHLQFPTLPMPILVFDGLGPNPSVQPSEQLDVAFRWSDDGTPDSASFLGYWDIGPDPQYATSGDPNIDLAHVISIDAYQFARAIAASAIDIQASGASDLGEEYGAFERDEDFTIAVLFRVDEPAWATAAGLAGRRSNTGVGYGLQIDATGHVKAVMQGATATATATASGTVHDRAPHWAVLVNDAGADTLRLYDDHGGSATASTAGTGSLAATGVPLRIGRDAAASATGGLQIARVLVFRAALTADQVAEVMTYGTDPSGYVDGGTSNRALWVPVPDYPGGSGAALLRFSAHHVPIGSGVGGFGVVIAAVSTNKIPSHDFANGTYWTAETGATLAQDVADCTGLPRGVRITVGTADAAIRCASITMGVGDLLSVVFYARTLDVGGRTLTVQLRTSAEVVIGSQTVTLTDAWQRFHVQLSTWANATPTAILRWRLGASATGSFDLAAPIWADFGADAPYAIQDAGLAVNASSVAIPHGDSLPQSLYEGEIYVDGIASTATPPSGATIASVSVPAAVNTRDLTIGAAGAPVFTATDGGGTPTAVAGTAFNWDEGFVVRGRWNYLELPESLGDQIGLVVAEASANSATYAAMALAVDAGEVIDALYLGNGGVNATAAPNAIISRAILRTREPKLP